MNAPQREAYAEYVKTLTSTLWTYGGQRLGTEGGHLDVAHSWPKSPPVFTPESSDANVIVPPDHALAARVRGMIPRSKRHRWFRSMKSSQALALSVFGNLKVLHLTHVLQHVEAEDGAGPAFRTDNVRPEDLLLEHEPQTLRDTTNVDLFVAGSHAVAVECKLSESEVGACSRPALSLEDSRFCDGAFRAQRGRAHRCSLAEHGIPYWEYIPGVLAWDAGVDHSECPLREPYQLVRNILAAVVSDGEVHLARGHALLLYDARNPAFAPRPDGAIELLRGSLRDARLLRRCSWQRLLAALDDVPDLRWLVSELRSKYGFATGPA